MTILSVDFDGVLVGPPNAVQHDISGLNLALFSMNLIRMRRNLGSVEQSVLCQSVMMLNPLEASVRVPFAFSHL